jgi:hypothetical protein
MSSSILYEGGGSELLQYQNFVSVESKSLTFCQYHDAYSQEKTRNTSRILGKTAACHADENSREWLLYSTWLNHVCITLYRRCKLETSWFLHRFLRTFFSWNTRSADTTTLYENNIDDFGREVESRDSEGRRYPTKNEIPKEGIKKHLLYSWCWSHEEWVFFLSREIHERNGVTVLSSEKLNNLISQLSLFMTALHISVITDDARNPDNHDSITWTWHQGNDTRVSASPASERKKSVANTRCTRSPLWPL